MYGYICDFTTISGHLKEDYEKYQNFIDQNTTTLIPNFDNPYNKHFSKLIQLSRLKPLLKIKLYENECIIEEST